MFQRIWVRIQKLFQSLFGRQRTQKRPLERVGVTAAKKTPPPLTDADLEFLFTELLEGVHQQRGQEWALKWLKKIEHRVSVEHWVNWLQRFGEKLLKVPTPNNELAARMVNLGELRVGAVGDIAYDIGMRLLTRHDAEPIWEYEGADSVIATPSVVQTPGFAASPEEPEELTPITLEELLVLLQQDENLVQQLSQQLGIETRDPDTIVEALIHQFQAANLEQDQSAAPLNLGN